MFRISSSRLGSSSSKPGRELILTFSADLEIRLFENATSCVDDERAFDNILGKDSVKGA